ncbi:MAG: hypothetical protein Q4Q31_09250 [Bacillota bacterium]|nr:hypothetical protein [Bacillota bacterium]
MNNKSIFLGTEEIYVGLIGMIALQDAMNASELLKPIFDIIKYPLLGMIIATMLYLAFKVKYKAAAWGCFIILFVLGLNTAKILSTNVVLYIAILCFLSDGKNLKKVARAVLWIIGGIFVLHMLMFLVNYSFSRSSLSYLEWNGLQRYNMYFDHPNNAAKYFVFICVLIEYAYADKIKLKQWFCLMISMGIIYYFTHSEAVFVTIILFVMSYGKNTLYGKNIIEFVARYGMAINAIISASCAMLITIPVISKLLLLLDGMGSGRFSNLFYAVQKYGLTLFGQKALFGSYQIVGGYNGIYADNFTVYCMTCMGICYIVIVCILFYFGAKKMDLAGKEYLCMFIVFSLFENRVLGIEAYFALIVAANSCLCRTKEIIGGGQKSYNTLLTYIGGSPSLAY